MTITDPDLNYLMQLRKSVRHLGLRDICDLLHQIPLLRSYMYTIYERFEEEEFNGEDFIVLADLPSEKRVERLGAMKLEMGSAILIAHVIGRYSLPPNVQER